MEPQTASFAAVAGRQRVQSVLKQEALETKLATIEAPQSSKLVAPGTSAVTGTGSSGPNLARQTTAAAPPAQPAPIQPKVENTSKQLGLPVPSLLLEGDEPSPSRAGPGRKFELGPEPVTASPKATEPDLPEAYGTGRLWLVARDPHCLYAHWDLTAQQQRLCNAQSVHQHLLVRVYQDHASGRAMNEIHLHPESRHWFIHVERAGATYVAELGFYPADGHWQSVALSEPVATPSATRAEPAPAQFATMTFESTPFFPTRRDDVSSEPSRPHFHQLSPGPGALEQPRPQTQSPASEMMASAPPRSPWTEAQAHVVAELSGWTIPRTELFGSVEITRLLHGRQQREVPLGLEELAPSSLESAIFSPAPAPPGEVSSPFGGEIPAQKQFWFNVNAELVIYGATEPDAQVTIGGRPIRLRPDGTFSYRFSLPDGTYDLPIAATAAHGDSRHAHLRFHRGTSYSGQVGVHPQDPSLRTPDPRHVA